MTELSATPSTRPDSRSMIATVYGFSLWQIVA
jgi:hypothetical protein